jgi:hypothetical protein
MERTPLLSSKPSTRSFTLEPSPLSPIICAVHEDKIRVISACLSSGLVPVSC